MDVDVKVANTPGSGSANARYVSNRPPLVPSPLVKLPLGSVKAGGWIRRQLVLLGENWGKRVLATSEYLTRDAAWRGGTTEGWERPAYWLRGFHDLALLLDDEGLVSEAEAWISDVIATQEQDGYFGEKAGKRIVCDTGQEVPDLWPHMVMLDALIAHHEHSGDERVTALMSRFFRWCYELPEEKLIPAPREGSETWQPFIQWVRAGDLLPQLYWLYNRTEEAWLLELAERVHRKVRPPEGEWLANHCVDFVQRFREPGTFYVQSGDGAHLAESEHWYRKHMDTWGGQPGGGFAADEFIRPGKTDPKQAWETCTMVELAKSFYLLGEVTGSAVYADRVENIMFNSFPASQTADLAAVHYLTAANQPQLDRSARHDNYNERHHGKNHVVYSSDPVRYRCCQHNLGIGWSYYAERLWMATGDNGLAAWMYGAGEVSAKVGDGGAVTIVEETDYPFDETVRMTIAADRSVRFPLYLRVPHWRRDFRVAVNGEAVSAEAASERYVVLDRTWRDGDVVDVTLGMGVWLNEWEKSGDSVTVNYGPLSFSLKIEEQWRRCGGTDAWPEWEVLPGTPWNYGLVVDRDDPSASLEVVKRGCRADQPWTPENAPIEIRARGRRIPNWTLLDEMVTALQASPVRSDEPEEEITLIPMGCARLRISCFPTIGDGPDAREWKRTISHDLYPLLPPHSMVQHGLGAGDGGG